MIKVNLSPTLFELNLTWQPKFNNLCFKISSNELRCLCFRNKHTRIMTKYPSRAMFPIITPADESSSLSWCPHVEQSMPTSNRETQIIFGSLHPCYLIVHVFIQLNKCIL